MMKRSFIVVGVLLISLSLTFIIPACNNAANTDSTTEADAATEALAGSMSAVIDSAAWAATKVTAVYNDNGLVITGTAADGSAFTLEIGEEPVVGIFPIRKGKLQSAKYARTSPDISTYYSPYNNTTGAINISYIDDEKVEGSFGFRGSNVSTFVLVEAGAFIAPIQKVTQ